MGDNIYGLLTGRKRVLIMLAGAATGIVVDLIFAAFGGRVVGPGDLILAAIAGALLGLSASLGEKRRKKRGGHALSRHLPGRADHPRDARSRRQSGQ
jgi:hypothetical protein